MPRTPRSDQDREALAELYVALKGAAQIVKAARTRVSTMRRPDAPAPTIADVLELLKQAEDSVSAIYALAVREMGMP